MKKKKLVSNKTISGSTAFIPYLLFNIFKFQDGIKCIIGYKVEGKEI